MVTKYVRVLEDHEINSRTGEIWSLYDVPKTWRAKVEKKILEDGFEFDDDGRVIDG